MFAGSAAAPAQFPRDGLPEVALLGRSNVGKSSLLNRLAGVRNLARVSGSPGRTRLVNFFRVGHDMYLADLPGYGYAKVAEAERRSWDRLVTSYLRGREPLALCLCLVDARHPAMESDLVLRDWLEAEGLPYAVVATKADKVGRGERARRAQELRRAYPGARDVLAVSAVDGTGVESLWRTIEVAAARHGEVRPRGREARG